MAIRTAEAEWKGTLREGTGTLESETGALSGRYSFSSRFEDGTGTNPEELIAAAHAGCFSMALAGGLARAGHDPERIHTTGQVHLEKQDGGFAITRVHLVCRARVPGLDADTFRDQAEGARKGCPVSKALAAVEVTLDATLEG